MLLGLANADIPRDPAAFDEARIARWADEGIRCLSVSFERAHQGDLVALAELREKLSSHGIHVAQMAGVNANLVHADPVVRQEALAAVVAAVKQAQALGATMISSGCGTTRDDWASFFYGPSPANFSNEARDRLIDGLRSIAPHIAESGLTYTIECHQMTTMGSPEAIRSVLDAVDSPAITANFDPVNLLDSIAATFGNAGRMQQFVATVGARYGASCHIKDVRVTDDFVCRIEEAVPGEGLLDFDAFFAAASSLPQPTALIVEHLRPDNYLSGLRFVRQAALSASVEFL